MQSTVESGISPETHRILTSALAAILTPVGYVAYLVAVRSFQRYPYSIEPLLSTGMLVYLLILGVTGGIAVLGWDGRLRVAPIVALGGLLIWPWFPGISPIGNTGYMAIPFVGVLFATAIEGSLRFADHLRHFVTTSGGRVALTVGLLHFLFGFGVQVYTRWFFWMEYSPASALVMGLIYVISGLVLVATGALSVQLWTKRRLRTPAVVTAGWFGWGCYGAWVMRAHLPLGHFTGINWMGLTPYPDYLLKWPVLVMALLLVAGAEVLLQKVGLTLLRGDRELPE